MSVVTVSREDVRLVLEQRNLHSHERPGIWDASNRPELANTVCAECAARHRLWQALRMGGRL